MSAHGEELGAVCGRSGCDGILVELRDGGCSCHINPPCDSCMSARPSCPVCGWEPAVETIINDHVVRQLPNGRILADLGMRELDPTRIDYHVLCHTHFSQRCVGVYPPGTTAEQVLEKVRGTFGGRFKRFGGGHFEYIAYTD